jgi:hypothetical protein
MALPNSMRYIPPPKPTDPTEVKMVTSGTSITFVGMFYSASETPYSQGVEIRTLSSLTDYNVLKIRGNHNFITTVDEVIQDQNYFNDTLSYENMGTADSKSQVSLDTSGKVSQVVDHRVEKRDLGQTDAFTDDSPYSDPDPTYLNPAVILQKHALELVVPSSLVQAGGFHSSYDGVIEPFDIRSISDRSSIELPFVSHSVKSDNSITNPKRESLTVSDRRDLKSSGTRPFLDSQESMGGIDLPGAFSDADPRSVPFSDSTQREKFYNRGSLSRDTEIRDIFIKGITSGSVTYRAARVEDVGSEEIVARHGFDFSQNDNFSYDSIVYGGLKK